MRGKMSWWSGLKLELDWTGHRREVSPAASFRRRDPDPDKQLAAFAYSTGSTATRTVLLSKTKTVNPFVVRAPRSFWPSARTLRGANASCQRSRHAMGLPLLLLGAHTSEACTVY